jgi:hypothetical protein
MNVGLIGSTLKLLYLSIGMVSILEIMVVRTTRSTCILYYGCMRSWILVCRELTKATEPFIKQEDEGKFRCKTCQKLFKATSFVEKHVANKHPTLVKHLQDVSRTLAPNIQISFVYIFCLRLRTSIISRWILIESSRSLMPQRRSVIVNNRLHRRTGSRDLPTPLPQVTMGAYLHRTTVRMGKDILHILHRLVDIGIIIRSIPSVLILPRDVTT